MTLLLGTRLVLCHSCSCNCGSGYLLRLPGLEGALRVAVLADVADGNALCVCCAGLQAVGESCCLYQLEISSVVVSGTGDLQGNAVGGVYALVVLRARGLCRQVGARARRARAMARRGGAILWGSGGLVSYKSLKAWRVTEGWRANV